jgi:hypothetical protein
MQSYIVKTVMAYVLKRVVSGSNIERRLLKFISKYYFSKKLRGLKNVFN